MGGMCGGGGGGEPSGGGGGSNSFTETLANIFTPNDGGSYVNGNFVDDNTGASISAGGTTSTGNVISGAPRQAEIMGQPHMLAYINEAERQMLKRAGGSELPGPEGIPSYLSWNDIKQAASDTWSEITSGGAAQTQTYNGNDDKPSAPATSLRPRARPASIETNNNDDDNKPATQPATATTTGALPADTTPRPTSTAGVSNTGMENFANLLTLFDGASYVNGQLVDDKTKASLTGGGYSSTGDYIYGVSDDSSNNVLDTTGMDSSQVAVATAQQQMQEDIPPSYLAYFASFLPGMVSPMFGGILGEKMLAGGLEDRKSIIDQQVAALEMGATPQFDAQGNYVGFDKSTMSTFADQVLGADDIMAFMPPGPNNPAYSADANKDGINDYDRFRTVYDAQSSAAAADPTGMSTEGGFTKTGSGFGAFDGTEYYVQGDGSVDMITNNIVPYDIDDVNVSTAAQEGNSRRGIYGTRGTSEDYDRYSRGGGGYAFMPAYMRKYMTGENFDVMAQKITLADGSTAYRTPDGKVLTPEQFENTAQTKNALTVAGADERYLQGYQDTDAMGMPVYFDAEGNPVGSLG